MAHAGSIAACASASTLGGTEDEGIALDDSGAMLVRRRVPTPQGDYRATVETVASLVLRSKPKPVGKAPSASGCRARCRSLSGRVKNSNSICLIGQPLQGDLEAALSREVRLANDANCFALSEAIDGAGRGVRVVFGVILGTGVGGGIVVDGRAVEWPRHPNDDRGRVGP